MINCSWEKMHSFFSLETNRSTFSTSSFIHLFKVASISARWHNKTCQATYSAYGSSKANVKTNDTKYKQYTIWKKLRKTSGKIHWLSANESIDLTEFLNLDKDLKSMRSGGRLFHKLRKRSEKKDNLEECLLKWSESLFKPFSRDACDNY